MHSSMVESSKNCAVSGPSDATHPRSGNEQRPPWHRIRRFDHSGAHAGAVAWENTTSIRVPERPPVLMWNLARLASTKALVSDRLTPEPSEAWSDGAGVRN